MSLVEHLVLFKFAAPADIVAAHSSFMQLKSQIPQIVELDFGAHLGVDAYPSMPNAVDRGDGYTHAAIVRFRTLEDLKEYIVHPAHQKWAADHSKHREKVCAIDFIGTPVKSTCPPVYKYALPAVVASLALIATWFTSKHCHGASKKQ